MRIIKQLHLLIIVILLTSCVQKKHLKTVTFKVDMTSVENPSHVGVRGNFTDNPWEETAPLTDENNDDIYEGTFSQETTANLVEFKFVNQNSDYELKDSDNRRLLFEYKPETIIYEAVFNNPEEKITKNKL
ncbi:hypothetical protein [Winogradskyella sp. R77965]|uniref:hypothetical protein n=1 Tax=Winogradskyella sp. R77965 TaxID=3093872 RepID=UPI0037DD230B